MQPAGAAPSSAPTIFASATDRMLRTLEGGSGGLAVTTEVDAGTVLTQLVAPSAGACSTGDWAGTCHAVQQQGAAPWVKPSAASGPAGGRLLFAATEEGSVRAYRLSLTPESPYTAVRPCRPAACARLHRWAGAVVPTDPPPPVPALPALTGALRARACHAPRRHTGRGHAVCCHRRRLPVCFRHQGPRRRPPRCRVRAACCICCTTSTECEELALLACLAQFAAPTPCTAGGGRARACRSWTRCWWGAATSTRGRSAWRSSRRRRVDGVVSMGRHLSAAAPSWRNRPVP